MNKDLTIQTLRWDLQAGDIEAAKSWQNILSEFSREAMPDILEETFRRYTGANKNLYIDRIEIELPLFTDAAELGHHVKTAVEKYLSSNMPGIRTQNENGYTVSNMLGWYLEKGIQAWFADIKRMHDPPALMTWLLEQPTGQIRRDLAIIAESENAAIRLISLFGEEQLDALVEKLKAPGLPPQWLDQVKRLFADEKNLYVSDQKKKWLIYKMLLQKLIAESHFDFVQFARSWFADIQAFRALDVRASIELIAGFKIKFHTYLPEAEWENLLVKNGLVLEENPKTNFAREKKTDLPYTRIRQGILDSVQEKISMFIENAGAVLLYPYLSIFFAELSLIDEQRKFMDLRAQMRAVCLVQYLSTGIRDFQEDETVLAKILCGCDPEELLIKEEDAFYERHKAASEELLDSLIGHWKKLKNTGIDGLRGNFLIRDGKLMEEEDNWVLHIERKGWDFLLDSLPFSIHFVKLPWMIKSLFVQW